MGAEIRRGDIVLATYPFTDLPAIKRRPAVVVSTSEREGNDLILAFITSKTERLYAGDVAVNSDDPGFTSSGLRIASAIRCGKLMTLDRTLLVGRLGRLTPSLMEKVDAGLKLSLGLG